MHTALSCKVIKCYYRNRMGSEDENLVCRTIWRSQHHLNHDRCVMDPASVLREERIRICNNPKLFLARVLVLVLLSLEGTPSINIHLSHIYRSILNEIQRAFSILEQDVLIVLRTGAFFAHSALCTLTGRGIDQASCIA